MNRRDFLNAVALGVAGSVSHAAGAPLPRPGLHLAAVASQLLATPDPVLSTVAAVGYRTIELPSVNQMTDPVSLRASLDRAGLSAPSRHVPMPALFTNWKLLLRESQILGSRVIVCAEVPPEQRATLAGYRQVAMLLNATGRIAESVGMQLALAPHGDDYRARPGGIPFDILMMETDPRLVRVQLDLATLARAERDPLSELARYGDRVVSLHINNVAAADDAPADLEAGRLDLRALLAAALQAGIDQHFVDDPRPGAVWERARTSLQYLTELDV